MSRYTDYARVTARYPDSAKSISADVMEPQFITPAEAELDGRLAPAYSVPFGATPETSPDTIVDLATDMAYIKAVGIRSKNGKPIADAVDATITRLLKGTQLLYFNGQLLPPLSTGGGWSSTAGFGSSFGMDNPLNWEVDGAAIAASEAKRDG